MSYQLRQSNVVCVGLFATREQDKYPCFEVMYSLLAEELDETPGLCLPLLDNQTVHFRVIACVYDLAAWCKSRNHQGWQGYYGCPICKAKGRRAERAMRWPPKAGPLRTHESELLESRNAATGTAGDLFGAKGANPLRHLLNDLTSCVIDVMHTVDLGSHRDHLIRLFDAKHKEEPYSIFRHVDLAEQILKEVQLPIHCTRFGTDLSTIGSWKAKESRLFLLVCWPLIQHFGSAQVWSNYEKLVAAIRGLTKVQSTYEEVGRYETMLQQWGDEIEGLYGVGELKLKAHLVSAHLADHVRRTGPCSLTSLYRYESVGGILARGLSGANAVGQQVAMRLHREAFLPVLVEENGSDNLKQYLEDKGSSTSHLEATAWPSHTASRFGFASSFWAERTNWDLVNVCCRHFDNERFADETKYHFEPFAKLVRKDDQGVTVFTSRGYDGARESCNFYCTVERDDALTVAEILIFVQVVDDHSQTLAETLAICSTWDVMETRFEGSCFVCREHTQQQILVTPLIGLHLNCAHLMINDTHYLSTLPLGVELLQ